MAHQLSFPIARPFKTADIGITIPFSMSSGNLKVSGTAKVDTGSEFCLFQRELAEELGIDVQTGFPVKLGTLAGSFTGYAHTVILTTFEISFESIVLFSPIERTNRNILGRIGWLNNLHLGLTMDDEMIYLSPAYQ